MNPETHQTKSPALSQIRKSLEGSNCGSEGSNLWCVLLCHGGRRKHALTIRCIRRTLLTRVGKMRSKISLWQWCCFIATKVFMSATLSCIETTRIHRFCHLPENICFGVISGNINLPGGCRRRDHSFWKPEFHKKIRFWKAFGWFVLMVFWKLLRTLFRRH